MPKRNEKLWRKRLKRYYVYEIILPSGVEPTSEEHEKIKEIISEFTQNCYNANSEIKVKLVNES
jgi:hypothetical protein